MQLSPEEYLKDAFKRWPGDWEGDFDYLDGNLQRHDWGDSNHGRMHVHLLSWFATYESDWHILTLPSLTLQISPTRFRVPDIAIFDSEYRGEYPAVTAPLLVIEVLSPEDTMMHISALEADYRHMGVANIWIIDPIRRQGWRCEPEGWFLADQFAVPGTAITLRLSNLPLV